MSRRRHVVLVGLMGAGKTTIGRPLARALGRPYRDNDADLRHRTGETAHDISASQGMDALHRAEADALRSALDEESPLVLSAPASAVDEPDLLQRMRREFVGWLDPDIDTLAARVTHATHRPDLGNDPRAFLAAQYAARASRFRAIAELVVRPVPGEPIDATVERIVDAVRHDE